MWFNKFFDLNNEFISTLIRYILEPCLELNLKTGRKINVSR